MTRFHSLSRDESWPDFSSFKFTTHGKHFLGKTVGRSPATDLVVVQLSSEKKCGHLGGKVLVPTSNFEKILNTARLASDVLNVPTVIMARTDANAAKLLTSDIDERDKPFLTGAVSYTHLTLPTKA